MKKWFLVCASFALTVGVSGANAGDLVLHAPQTSKDGSYIIKLEGSQTHFDKLELYRSVNGSEFKLLATVPYFKAISQLVNRNGVYGYKIRGVSASMATEFSEPVFVHVQSKSMQLQLKTEKPVVPVSAELALGL